MPKKTISYKYWALAAALGAPGAIVGLYLWASGQIAQPKLPYPSIYVHDKETNAPKTRPETLKILSYNIHYGVGHEDDFDKRQTKEAIIENLNGIAKLINRLDADIVLLQEVDFDSARTARIDQLLYLAERTKLPYIAPTITWGKNYVPYPYWPIKLNYGRMVSGQAILSKYPIIEALNVPLPQPKKNPFFYNDFYLRRQFTHATIDAAGEILDVFNIHNEAFGGCNRIRQTKLLRDYLSTMGNTRIIVGGDFNANPPELIDENPQGDMADCGPIDDKSIRMMRQLPLKELFSKEDYRKRPQETLTFSSRELDERLDYLFFSPDFSLEEGHVVYEAGKLSDHFPLFAKLKL